MRILLSQECARIMVDEGVKDFLIAKRKAAARLRVSNRAWFPNNTEIEQALREHQRLFKAPQQTTQLKVLREAALEAMTFLKQFNPRLVGPVLAGTANAYADVNLHLFADTAEEVLLFLLEQDIPVETTERRHRFGHGGHVYLPAFRFTAGEVAIELTVFQCGSEREAPRSPVDGKPMRRAGIAELKALLALENGAQ